MLKQHVAAVRATDRELMTIIENWDEVMSRAEEAMARIVIF
jgi:hypothetical protein